MSSRRVIVRSAVLGVTITAVFVTYQLITDPQSPISRSPVFMLLFVVLCPPSLISLAFNSAEVGSGDFYTLWAVIGVLNAALYGSVRALLLRRSKKAE